MLVIDASAALQAAAARDGFAPLAPYQPVSPPLMWVEALSALHETYWRREISPALASIMRDRLLDSPIERHDHPDLHRTAWEVAERLGWAKLYDAQYVALAQLLKCDLVTRDSRLRRGAGRLLRVIDLGEL